MTRWIWFPDQGSNPGPRHWERRVPALGHQVSLLTLLSGVCHCWARTGKTAAASASLLQFPGGLAGLGSGAFTATAWAQFPVMEVNFRTDLMAQQVKNPTVKETQKTWVWFLGQEDPLEEGTATHSSILAWRTPLTEEPGGLQSKGHKELDRTASLLPRVPIVLIYAVLYPWVISVCWTLFLRNYL